MHFFFFFYFKMQKKCGSSYHYSITNSEEPEIRYLKVAKMSNARFMWGFIETGIKIGINCPIQCHIKDSFLVSSRFVSLFVNDEENGSIRKNRKNNQF